MILETKIDIPSTIFGIEFNQVSIEIEEPINDMPSGIIYRLLVNNNYLGVEHMIMMEGEVFNESDFINELKEYFKIEEMQLI